MKNRYVLSVLSFLMASSSAQAFDLSRIKSGIMKRYYGWWLIDPIYQVADAKSEERCSDLKGDKFQHIIVLKNYRAPGWVNWLSNVSKQESMFDYAYDIYQTMQLEMNEVQKSIKEKISKNSLTADSQQKLEDPLRDWRALEQKLIFVLGAKNANIEVTQKNVTDNIDAAVSILEKLIAVLRALTPAAVSTEPIKSDIRKPEPQLSQPALSQKQAGLDLQRVVLPIIEEVENTKKTIVALRTKPRISWIERKHRKKQADWLVDYVTNACRKPSE